MLNKETRAALERIRAMRQNFEQPPHDRDYLLARYADLGLAVTLAQKLLADDDCDRALIHLYGELDDAARAALLQLTEGKDFAFLPEYLRVAVNAILDKHALDLSGMQRSFVLRRLASDLRDDDAQSSS